MPRQRPRTAPVTRSIEPTFPSRSLPPPTSTPFLTYSKVSTLLNNNTNRPPLRPPLKTQINTIMDQVTNTTQDIKLFQLKLQNQKYNNQQQQYRSIQEIDNKHEQPIITLPALMMTVGTLTSRTGGIIKLYNDRAEYDFSHPYASGALIEMIMYYRDLQQIFIKNNGKTIVWHISKELEVFRQDYNPASHSHAGQLSIEFLNSNAAQTMLNILRKY